ncbi:uncharacterized protein B0J16DRAFT_387784 [Fusarium flagelliforme]|nr:uncharacterized protein B0J16DRAFT_387784 [Fusarium flagelliforme]KAH7179955.1 hypothetical protein B0J16DRAFT_387784 [Fusarium flagelliforme]
MATEMPLDQRASPSRVKQSLTPPKASFRILPPEIRLMIWEAACIPFAEKDGVHYIDIDMVEDYENRGSLYTRDMGLWNACKESRDFIAAHYHLDLWRLAQTEPFNSIKMQHAMQATRRTNARPVVSSNNDFFTIAFGLFENYSNLEPTYHRLCIRTSSPASLIARIRRLKLYLPMVKGTREIKLVRNWNLTIERDSSFDLRAPSTWQALIAEKSQRSLWYNCLFDTWDKGLPCILIDRSRTRSYIVKAIGPRILRLEDECYFGIETFPTWHAYWNIVRLWRDSHPNGTFDPSMDICLPCSVELDLLGDVYLAVLRGIEMEPLWTGMEYNWLRLREDNR